MKRAIFSAFLGVFSIFLRGQDLPDPASFLGYEIGDQFTPHHRVLGYFQAVAEASPAVHYLEYGQTYEGRALAVAILVHPDYQDSLEHIRQNNLMMAGLQEGTLSGPRLPIVWLSYNIHGDEASSSEAAMQVLHQLSSADTAGWLRQTVVIIDPCTNPDGRERYVNWYRQVANQNPNPALDSWEHRQPWPGGRNNHYLFDLNRDWAWQTQIESQHRARLYHKWMPQVHVDLHEMRHNDSYFFGPAARPIHALTTDWQREFQKIAADNHGRYFDQRKWLYFTKEVFDLLYPSYGDTWPTFHGAVGFTYEQAGGSRAGLQVIRENGDTLTLADRTERHLIASLSTVEAAVKNRKRLLEEFDQYFDKARTDPPGKYKTYIIPANQSRQRITSLLATLDRQLIRYYHPQKAGRTIKGFDFGAGQENSYQLQEKDILIPVYQSQGHLVQVLFEPNTELQDSLTYDLTAWALPYAYNLNTIATTATLTLGSPADLPDPLITQSVASPYAFLLPWEGLASARMLNQLWKAGFKVRLAKTKLAAGGKALPAGTLVITRADNSRMDFSQIEKIATQTQTQIVAVSSGANPLGRDLGSEAFPLLKQPRIALLAGKGISPTSLGEIWHLFDAQLGIQVSILRTGYLSQIDLSDFDVLVLPQGRYNGQQKDILTFAKRGGKVVAIEDALAIFSSQSPESLSSTALFLAIQNKSSTTAPLAHLGIDLGEQTDPTGSKYVDRFRAGMAHRVAGSIYQVNLDATHPISYGVGGQVFFIKRNADVYPYLKNSAKTVGFFPEEGHRSGFTGSQLKREIKNSMAVGVENYGQGKVVYFSDSPAFRGFWEGSKLLLINSVFFDF